MQKQNKNFKEVEGIDPEFWESGVDVSEAKALETPEGKKGVSIRLGKKVDRVNKEPYRRFNKTVWIDEDIDLPSWLGWAIKSIKKLYFKLFRKRIRTLDEEVAYWKTKSEETTNQLVLVTQKLEDAQTKNEETLRKIEFANKVLDKLQDFETKHDQLTNLISESITNNTGKEDEIKTKIKENPWLLGLECGVEAKNKDVDPQTQIDLHIKTKYNQDRIFELKSPNLKPFERKKDTSRVFISPVLADGISELILYLQKTDWYSNQKTSGNYGIQKASGYILIGKSLTVDEAAFLKELNFHLYPHIQILTYDDLEENIKQELEIIKNIKNSEKTEQGEKN